MVILFLSKYSKPLYFDIKYEKYQFMYNNVIVTLKITSQQCSQMALICFHICGYFSHIPDVLNTVCR